MSILPKKAVTRPSGVIATQESSSVGTSGGFAPAAVCASASPMKAGPAAVTIRAPDALRNSRRGRGGVMVVSLAICVFARFIARLIAAGGAARHLSPARSGGDHAEL